MDFRYGSLILPLADYLARGCSLETQDAGRLIIFALVK